MSSIILTARRCSYESLLSRNPAQTFGGHGVRPVPFLPFQHRTQSFAFSTTRVCKWKGIRATHRSLMQKKWEQEILDTERKIRDPDKKERAIRRLLAQRAIFEALDKVGFWNSPLIMYRLIRAYIHFAKLCRQGPREEMTQYQKFLIVAFPASHMVMIGILCIVYYVYGPRRLDQTGAEGERPTAS
ncbi:unnamed protein product [Zymoseptoria tritici ST99CH_3D1]|nr:unnamed protein product [Zymoseptoria tritici ST99CH_3D1]